jgi:hypothetical protein
LKKLDRYLSEDGHIYETKEEALIADFSCDDRARKAAASLGCGVYSFLWTLLENRKVIKQLLKELEIKLGKVT